VTTHYAIRVRAFPELFLMKGISTTCLRSDANIQEYIKHEIAELSRQSKPIPAPNDLLKEAMYLQGRWFHRFGVFSKAKIFTDIKEIRRAITTARKGDKAATFGEYEVVEFEVRQINASSIDQFHLETIPTPKKRTKKVLVKAIP
jgi:hypothetical protein